MSVLLSHIVLLRTKSMGYTMQMVLFQLATGPSRSRCRVHMHTQHDLSSNYRCSTSHGFLGLHFLHWTSHTLLRLSDTDQEVRP